jgi:hypothetical protein
MFPVVALYQENFMPLMISSFLDAESKKRPVLQSPVGYVPLVVLFLSDVRNE